MRDPAAPGSRGAGATPVATTPQPRRGCHQRAGRRVEDWWRNGLDENRDGHSRSDRNASRRPGRDGATVAPLADPGGVPAPGPACGSTRGEAGGPPSERSIVKRRARCEQRRSKTAKSRGRTVPEGDDWVDGRRTMSYLWPTATPDHPKESDRHDQASVSRSRLSSSRSCCRSPLLRPRSARGGPGPWSSPRPASRRTSIRPKPPAFSTTSPTTSTGGSIISTAT